jgi:hypothetical protein
MLGGIICSNLILFLTRSKSSCHNRDEESVYVYVVYGTCSAAVQKPNIPATHLRYSAAEIIIMHKDNIQRK